MGDPLAGTFEVDLGCDASEARTLASLARARLPKIAGTPEDTEEDLVLRLRDPRIFGAFVEPLLASRRLARVTRIALAEHAFDLLPLPRAEGEVVLVETRAPPRLLALASFLGENGSFSVLQLMHLVFAVFLDRSLVARVERPIRSAVLRAVVGHEEASPRLRALYGAIHLAGVPEAEAHREFRRILETRSVPDEVKRLLASIVSAADGVARLAALAQSEGLLPDSASPDAPGVVANIPRLPAALAKPADRWRRGKRSRP